MKPLVNLQGIKNQMEQHVPHLPPLQPPVPKVFLVDSENMGDIWGALLEKMTFWDRLVIFYTKNSSHMACESTIQFLKHRKKRMEWIACVEGPNALDFQLVTELGARISRDKNSEYIIISNDKGFDAAVDYWTKRGRKIRRTKDIPALASNKKKKKADTYSHLPAQDKRLVEELCKAVCVENKNLLYQALTRLMQADKGKKLYKAVKKDSIGSISLGKLFLTEPEERVRHYLDLMYREKACDPERMLELYRLSKKVPAVELFQTMTKEFGITPGRTLYQIMKNHLVVLSQIEAQKNPAPPEKK